jgi:ubiquinone/menaquinone biosynthesis C-methylase UbiE
MKRDVVAQNDKYDEAPIMTDKPIAAGKSSFSLLDSSRLFSEIGLTKGITMLDLACGIGAYATAASAYVGTSGKIVAVDLWEEGIDALKDEIKVNHIHNISPKLADVSRHIPMADASVDLCLMAAVLHDLVQDNTDQGTLKEVVRTLKPDGRLAVVEFIKKDGPPGPPENIRMSPQDLREILEPFGLLPAKTIDIGEHLYVSIYYGT